MLKLVLGRINSGKTTYIQNRIKSELESGNSGIILLVPEQFSFESERQIINLLGEKEAMKVEVCSFSRLAQNSVGDVGGVRRLSEAGKVALMSSALEQTADKLTVYGKYATSSGVISEMLKLSDEFKQCAVSSLDLEKAALKTADGMLKNKLGDLSLVMSAFDALVAQRFTDERDLLDIFAEKLATERSFEKATVFIDGFKGFTQQEFKIISHILSQSENCYVTLCTDSVFAGEYDISPFACVRDTAKQLINLAGKSNVAVKTEFPPEYSGRYAQPCLEFLEENLYSVNALPYEGDADAVTVFSARTVYEECDFTAIAVKKLLRENGYRCRDIAIISRSEGDYSKALRSALKRHGVPVFEDKRRSLATQAPVVLVRAAAEIASKGYSTDAVLRLLKTQLTPLSVEETSMLEEYVSLWHIDGKKWLSQWVNNPSGLGSAPTDADRAALARLNELREKVVRPLEKLRKAEKNADDSYSLIKGLYEYLIDVEAPKMLKKAAVELNNSGEKDDAIELGRVWDYLMEVFDQLAAALAETKVSIKRITELFNLVLGVVDLGVIPSGIDEITIGSADRIRVNRPKAVFAVGVNDGVFPLKPSGGKVLNDGDRRVLTEMGVAVAQPSQYSFLEERFIAYNALCCAYERLFLSYAKTDFSGAEASPSELITQVKSILPQCKLRDISSYSTLDLIESEASAFRLAAKGWNTQTVQEESLKACFALREGYAQRMQALDRANGIGDYAISDQSLAKRFFGNDIYASATKIEDYNKCPFLFFCRYGLKLGERKKAEIDSALSGTVTHYVLENLVKKHGKDMVKLSQSDLENEVKGLLDEFAAENFDNASERDERFDFLYRRLCSSLCVVASRLINEMRLSDFEPADFELQIGGKEPEIKAFEIDLPDGGRVILNGKVDRVDILQTDTQTFVRVMDYKTGTKAFDLSDVLHGLNMQMLLYLFAIKAGGEERYGNRITPAGVLYIPAKSKSGQILRSIGKEKIDSMIIKDGRMSGIILDDDRVIHATDRNATGTVIAGRKGLTGSLIGLEQLGKLEKTVCESVRQMGIKLHGGKIQAKPNYGGTYHLPCDYCDYADICLTDGKSAGCEYKKISFGDCLNILDKGGEEDA